MSGLEVAASAAGLISMSFTLFKGCVQAFQFANSAAHLGGEADIIRCKLEWEQYRLYQWAEQVGLEERPYRNLNWTIAANILKQMEALLTSSNAWKERYHLDVMEVGKNALECQDSPTEAGRKAGFGLLLAKLKPKYTSTSSRIIQESNTPIKKIEWAAVGRDKLQKLVEDISYFNKCLHSLLESTDRDFVTSSLAALLRDIIARSNVSSELDIVKELLKSTSLASPEAVASAASLKKIRLVLGLEKGARDVPQAKTGPTGVKPQLIYLKPKHLVRESKQRPPREREVAYYKSDLVMVEWRIIKRSSEFQAQEKVNHLAIMLGNIDCEFFHSLRCIGVLPKDKAYEPEDDDHVCYGLAFKLLGPQSPASSSILPSVLTLSDVYTNPRRPSLNERLSIALALAEALLQLHTTGWLHKGIRPANILFLAADSQSWESRTTEGPFLAGYEYARPSNAATETVPPQPEWDLYRHPSAQGPARTNFRKSFDLFALGCIFLEIALWRKLQDILTDVVERSNDGNLNEKDQAFYGGDDLKISQWSRAIAGRDRLLHNEDQVDVAFHAGDTFRNVVLMCLNAPSDDQADEGLETQKIVVDELRSCKY